MRRRFLSSLSCVLVTVALAVTGCSLTSSGSSSVAASRSSEVVEFKPIQPEEWKLPNGLTVVYLKDDELPLVRGRLFIRGGDLWGPEAPVGVVGAMGGQMRQGGAGGLSADQLDQSLEELAASVASSFSNEFGGAAFSCLGSDIERVFKIFSDVVLRPRFEGDRLALWKGQALEAIRRRAEDPGTVASIAFSQILYGNTPYGRVEVEKDVAAISRDQMIALHQKFVRPDGAILVVTGRIERAAVEKLVEQHFGAWEPRGSVLPPAPPISTDPKPGVYFITLPFSQASVQMGQLGLPRLTPDYPAIDIFNEVFGSSGFGSRLMQKVRTELGLTYGVSGGIAPGVVKGVNYMFLQTKADSVAAAMEASMGVLAGMQSNPPTEEEMSEKKTAVRNSYVLNFDSIDEIAVRNARLKLLDYPVDYDQTYLEKITSVSPEAVQEVAKKRWDRSKFIFVVVGNEAAYANLQKAMAERSHALHGFDLVKMRFESALVRE